MRPTAQKSMDFSARYDRMRATPATDPSLFDNGFEMYQPIGKIWAHKVTPADAETHFPARKLQGKWGRTTAVEEGDYLALSFPAADEIYVIKKEMFPCSYKPITEQAFVPSQTEALALWENSLRRSDVFRHAQKVYAKIATEDGKLKSKPLDFKSIADEEEKKEDGEKPTDNPTVSQIVVVDGDALEAGTKKLSDLNSSTGGWGGGGLLLCASEGEGGKSLASKLAEKDFELEQRDTVIAMKDAEIARLQLLLNGSGASTTAKTSLPETLASRFGTALSGKS